MPNYHISVNPQLARVVEREIKEKKYANRSEFFRDLLRKYYVLNIYTIEEIVKNDPDYHVIQKRKKRTTFIPLRNVCL